MQVKKPVTKTKCKKKVCFAKEIEKTLETQPVTKSVISKQCRKLESSDTTGNKRLKTCKRYILQWFIQNSSTHPLLVMMMISL